MGFGQFAEERKLNFEIRKSAVWSLSSIRPCSAFRRSGSSYSFLYKENKEYAHMERRTSERSPVLSSPQAFRQSEAWRRERIARPLEAARFVLLTFSMLPTDVGFRTGYL